MLRSLKSSSLALALFLAAAPATLAAAEPKVVVSIKPLHSLVAAVMKGVATPELLITQAGSPHDATLRPSQASALQSADLVVWVGPQLETFLAKPVKSLPKDAETLQIGPLFGLEKEGGHDDHDDHDEHGDKEGHDDHKDDDHAAKKDDYDDDHKDEHKDDQGDDHKDEHGDEHKEAGHEDEHDHHHHHEGGDPHVWLDVKKAVLVVEELAKLLPTIDPANSDLYAQNAKAITEELNVLEKELRAELASLSDAHFLVFHDAYGHFTESFGLKPAESVTINPTVPPSVAKIRELEKVVKDENIKCAYREPQFSDKTLKLLSDQLPLTIGVLDPLGAYIEPGPKAYGTLLRNLSNALTGCLKQT